MTGLRRRRLEDLQRRGLAPRTQQDSLAAVTHRAPHDRRAPDPSSNEALRLYVLCRRQAKQGAASTCRMPLDGIRCCSECTRPRPWPVFERVRPQKRQTRPVVWRLPEVRHLRALVEHPTAPRWLRMSDAGGRRLTAGTPRQVAALDGQRLVVWVRQATGRQDRGVPLAPRVLA
jgi:hypothetical protein